jgi:hypothetical protein
MIQQLSL